jgi:SPP1 gp7 family putative phage head morphogenesis protein
VTTTTLPPDRVAELRAALRKHAGAFIARQYRHDLLRARAVKGMQQEAVDEFQRQVVAPILREVGSRLATFDQRGPAVILDQFPELRALRDEVVRVVARGSDAVKRLAVSNLGELVRHEVDWGRETARKVLRIEPPPMVAGDVHREATNRPFMGQRLDSWFSDMLSQPAAKNALQWIQKGVNEGLSTDSIVKGLRGTPSSGYLDGWLTGTSRDLSTLVRTASTHFSSTANTETFRSLGMDEYRWVATLDTRTCPVCGKLDGQVFPIGEGPLPPAPHANCRCAVVPVFGEPEGTRASQDGQVPAELTFPDWLEGRSQDEQDEVLGVTRARAWRAGKLDFDKMIGRDLDTLTIAELRRLDRIPDDEQEET